MTNLAVYQIGNSCDPQLLTVEHRTTTTMHKSTCPLQSYHDNDAQKYLPTSIIQNQGTPHSFPHFRAFHSRCINASTVALRKAATLATLRSRKGPERVYQGTGPLFCVCQVRGEGPWISATCLQHLVCTMASISSRFWGCRFYATSPSVNWKGKHIILDAWDVLFICVRLGPCRSFLVGMFHKSRTAVSVAAVFVHLRGQVWRCCASECCSTVCSMTSLSCLDPFRFQWHVAG